MKSLVNENAPRLPQNLADDSPLKRQVLFSFQFYRQRDYFGLGDCDRMWYVLLTNALSCVSQMTFGELINNAKGLHYHKIQWDHRNIPVQPADFDWIPEMFRAELWQFHITKSRGRVIGFMSDNVFYVVLLDPEHNIQPSSKHNYALRLTRIQDDFSDEVFDGLAIKYQELVNLVTAKNYEQLERVVNIHKQEYRNIVYATLDTNEDYQWYMNNTGGMSFTDVIGEYLIMKEDHKTK